MLFVTGYLMGIIVGALLAALVLSFYWKDSKFLKSLEFIREGRVSGWVWIAMSTGLFLTLMSLPFVPGVVGEQAIKAWDAAGSWLVAGYGVILGTYGATKTISTLGWGRGGGARWNPPGPVEPQNPRMDP